MFLVKVKNKYGNKATKITSFDSYIPSLKELLLLLSEQAHKEEDKEFISLSIHQCETVNANDVKT
jgi:hypothetical protein